MHLYDGEEAVSVGVIEALQPQDAIVATYREHGQALARGIGMNVLMAEMYGKLEGCCRGRGGSMHIFDRATRFYGGNAIVGGGLPLAVGTALGDKMLGRGAITACFFGDGAVDEGTFHESMNLGGAVEAAGAVRVREQPLCDGHGAGARRGRNAHRAQGRRLQHGKRGGGRYGCRRGGGRGASARSTAIRRTNEPFLLECRTYRFRAHSMFDAQLYRSKQEIEAWRAKDPIQQLQAWLEQTGLMHATR